MVHPRNAIGASSVWVGPSIFANGMRAAISAFVTFSSAIACSICQAITRFCARRSTSSLSPCSRALDHALTPEPADELVLEPGVVGEKADYVPVV